MGWNKVGQNDFDLENFKGKLYLIYILKLMIKAFSSNNLMKDFVKLFISWAFENYIFVCNRFSDF